MDLHESLMPLAPLLGTWRGEGRGEYPTIEPFTYAEEATFSHTGKPFLVYTQRTWSPDTGQPLHAETGYWRHSGGGRVEVVLAHPFGAAEVLEGSVADGALRLASRPVVTTEAAKRVDGTERDLDLDGDVLRYRMRMAAVGEPMTHHLAAALRRDLP